MGKIDPGSGGGVNVVGFPVGTVAAVGLKVGISVNASDGTADGTSVIVKFVGANVGTALGIDEFVGNGVKVGEKLTDGA